MLSWVAPIAVGLFAAALAGMAWNLTYKPMIMVVGVLCTIALAAVTGLTKPLLIATWLFSLTYFRVSFPIESMAGFQGFYVTVADAVFPLLLAYWAYEASLRKRLSVSFPAPVNSGLALYALPLLAVCFVSALQAERPDWAMYEVIRVAKIPVFLLYCRHNIGKREFWVCVAVLGLSVVFQTALGLLQLRGLLGSYVQEAWAPEPRPNGTLAHASIFAGYMLLLMPVCAALAVTLPHRLLKLASAGAAFVGLIGIALTQSRIPWALSVLELLALAALLVALRIVPFKRTLGVLAVGAVLGAFALVPLMDRIQRRIASDFNTALNWRLEMNRVGLNLAQKYPFFGIGLANFPIYLTGSGMEFADSLDDAFAGVYNRPGTQAAPVKGFHWVWVPHNIYLLLLAETGVFGLLAFLLLVGMSIRAGIRAVQLGDTAYAGAAAGLLVGICGVLIENGADWAMWLDPVLYTWMIAAALLRNLPGILRNG